MLLFVLLLLNIASVRITEANFRIVGGEVVKDRTAFAYQASIRYDSSHFCGGSIIDQQHILTAAHCCLSQGRVLPASHVTVAVGNLQLTGDKSERIYQIKYIFVHDDYNSEKIINDICLLRISGNFSNWTDKISPIALQNSAITSGICKVSGWGHTDYSSEKNSEVLLAVEVPIYNWSNCKIFYTNLTENQICAYEERKDACQGDSGGPFVCNMKLTGIVSYGANCGIYPGVYTEVYKYLNWIEQQKQRSSAPIFMLSKIVLFSLTLVTIAI